jgi:hypothetical protein
MLEIDYGKKLMEDLWDTTPTKVKLPESMVQQFFAMRGPMTVVHENRRGYHRYYMRGKAVLKRGTSLLGTYTKDVSRQGVGFLSPVQLMPKEKVQLRLPTTELSLQVARCQRIGQECFDCGARFAL